MKLKKLLPALLCFFIFITVLHAKSPRTISVLYFKNLRNMNELKWLSKGIADMLITDLSSSTKIIVIEREQLDKVLNEQKLSMTGLTSQKDAVAVGKLLNAKYLVTGSFIGSNNALRVNIKIINIETGKIIGARVMGSVQNIFTLQNNIAKKIFTKMGLSVPKKFTKETKSVKAVKLYYKGLVNLDAGKVNTAMQQFNKAVAIDPLYTGPQKGLEAGYLFLKNFRKRRHQRQMNKLYKKVAYLNKKRKQQPFVTYLDVIRSKQWIKMSAAERAQFNKKNRYLMQYQSPGHCAWAMNMALYTIAAKEHTFGIKAGKKKGRKHTKNSKRILKTITAIVNNSKRLYKGDTFYADFIYTELLALNLLRDYKRLKYKSEQFMTRFPDHRMNYAVENFYKRALDQLKKSR